MRYRIIDGELVKTPADEATEQPRMFSRRRFLGASFFAIGATTLSACGGNCDPTRQDCSSSGGGGYVGGGS